MGDVNGPINGFHLIKVGTDDTPPTPDPMTFASAPAPAGESSITMTATTASDTGGVEYFFDETSGNPGGSDSVWQDSPVYSDTGLSAGTAYTYTVKARDKSNARNATADSDPASATTLAAGRGPAPLKLQWSSDLGASDPWTSNEAAIPAPPGGTVNGVVFVVTGNALDSDIDDVQATIPSGEGPDGKLFGRLFGAEN